VVIGVSTLRVRSGSMFRGALRLAAVVGMLATALALPLAGIAHPREACTVEGTDGDDVLRGTTGHDVICGKGGHDTLLGDKGNDKLRGGKGSDTLNPGPGNDQIFGGTGVDLVSYRGQGRAVRVNLKKRIARRVGFDRLQAVEGAAGGALSDLLRGNRGHNVFRGYGGTDVLRGRSGEDALYGGIGTDVLWGGPGVDILNGGPGQDGCRQGPGHGTKIGCP
jgi:Ca2+-binding RTX toxin-like protein